jgi:L-ribulose-5-phosphate 3-epimerase
MSAAIEPLAIGVCSWSLQVTSIPELKGFLDRLGVDVVQVACGDPHHASWAEGDAMPAAAVAAGFRMSGAMLGFPGEDYTTPAHIERTGGCGDAPKADPKTSSPPDTRLKLSGAGSGGSNTPQPAVKGD